jgi:hypothetical protein
MIATQSSALPRRSLWRRRVAAQLVNPEGCRRLAGDNIPGTRSTVSSRPGRALEHSSSFVDDDNSIRGGGFTACASLSTGCPKSNQQANIKPNLNRFKPKNDATPRSMVRSLSSPTGRLMKVNVGYFCGKNSHFFYRSFYQNIGQIGEKCPKKPCKLPPKTMRFLNDSNKPKKFEKSLAMVCGSDSLTAPFPLKRFGQHVCRPITERHLGARNDGRLTSKLLIKTFIYAS